MKNIGDVRKELWGVMTIVRKIILGLLLAAALSFACTRSGASSTVADVCDMEDGSFVAVEGFLQLPNFLEAETNSRTQITMYELFLTDQPDGKSPTITTRITGTNENETNRIADLPVDGYTQRDLKIFTASGETVGATDRVRISGELQKGSVKGGKPCILKSEKIEKR
jgi:hypothetical protein